MGVTGLGPVPQIAIRLHADGPDTVGIESVADNFRFVPRAVTGPHVPGEGHAHIYVGGVRVPRAYDGWHQITGVTGGERIQVTLNANSREVLAIGDTPIAASITAPNDQVPGSAGPRDSRNRRRERPHINDPALQRLIIRGNKGRSIGDVSQVQPGQHACRTAGRPGGEADRVRANRQA